MERKLLRPAIGERTKNAQVVSDPLSIPGDDHVTRPDRHERKDLARGAIALRRVVTVLHHLRKEL